VVGANCDKLRAHLHKSREEHGTLPGVLGAAILSPAGLRNGAHLAYDANIRAWRNGQFREMQKPGIAQVNIRVSCRRLQQNVRTDGRSL